MSTNNRAEANKRRAAERQKKAKVTSSGTRSARSRASRQSAQKKTTSSGRGAGKTTTVDSRTQRQKVSKAKVTSSGGGTKGSAKVTSSRSRSTRITRGTKPNVTASSGGSARTKGGPSRADAANWKKYNQSAAKGTSPGRSAPGTINSPGNAQPTSRSARGQITANRMKRTLTRAAEARKTAATKARAGRLGKIGAIGTAAAVGLNAGPVADGTLKNKATGPKQGPPAPKKNPKKETVAKRFDRAFAAARRAGKAEFVFEGKRYNTRMK